MQMTNKDYHARDELSASQCKLLLENPYCFLNKIETKQTDCMKLGSAIHKLILEPEDFNQEFVVMPEVNLRTKDGKDFKRQFEAENVDETILSESMYQLAQKCSESVLKTPAKKLLKNGLAEQSYFGELDGIKVRCRPDYYIPEQGMIVDIKKCVDASPDGFQRAAAHFKYDLQAAFYMDVMASIGKPINVFVFVCIEAKDNLNVGLHRLTDKAIEHGRWQYQQALRISQNLEKYNTPLYRSHFHDDYIHTVDLPAYLYKQSNFIPQSQIQQEIPCYV